MPRGGFNPGAATLSDDQVLCLRERVAAGEKVKPLAIEVGVSVNTVVRAVRGETYCHVGGPCTDYKRHRRGVCVSDEERLARDRAAYAASRDERLEKRRAYEAAKSEERRQVERDARSARQRERYATDPVYRDKKNAESRARYAADPAYHRECCRRWEEKNPEAAKAYRTFVNQQRRCAPEDYIDPLVALELSDGMCGICGEEIEFGTDFHVDHTIPLAKGGTHSYDNVQASHPHCNWSKSDTLPWNFDLTPIRSSAVSGHAPLVGQSRL